MSRERWEYRVVCADGNHRWGAALRYMTSRSRARFMRQRASSDEFWAHVFPQDGPPDDSEPDETVITAQSTPCRVCGEYGPCGYDAEGRPMLHATEDDDE